VFEENGRNPAEEWNRLVTVADEQPRAAASGRAAHARGTAHSAGPVSRKLWTRRGHAPWRQIQVTAFPLVGEADQLLGAMNIFWAVE
jgi:hypothetical protein